MLLAWIFPDSLSFASVSNGVLICKLDKETFKREFESHWVLCHI